MSRVHDLSWLLHISVLASHGSMQMHDTTWVVDLALAHALVASQPFCLLVKSTVTITCMVNRRLG